MLGLTLGDLVVIALIVGDILGAGSLGEYARQRDATDRVLLMAMLATTTLWLWSLAR